MKALVAGIDVGGSNIRVAVGDADTPTAYRYRRTSAPSDYPAFLGRIVTLVEEACREADVEPRRLGGIGIGLPGTVAGGVATFVPALPALDAAAIGPDLQAHLGAPVWLANDAHCALLAEQRLGAAIGHQHVALVVVGTGVGGAVLVDGRLYQGGRGAAGAFGWLPAEAEPGSRHGAWEQAASGRALTGRARRLGLTPEELMTRAADGDRSSQEVVGSYAYTLGRGLAAIASAWDPELLVVAGVVTPHFAVLSEGIARAFDDWASPAGRKVPRVPAQLGPDAGVLGALCLADEYVRRMS